MVHQGASAKDVYRFGMWDPGRPRQYLLCVRAYRGADTVNLPARYPLGKNLSIRPGAWYWIRFGARSRRDRVELLRRIRRSPCQGLVT